VAALLELKDVRVDEGGSPAVDRLSFATTGSQVVVLGAPHALFEAASGMRRPAAGEIWVDGVAVARAVADRKVAGAPLDPALPLAWTPRKYVQESAALVGLSGSDRTRLVADAIERMKLEPVVDQPLSKAVLHARRATVIAAAMATGAKVIFLEDPLVGLADDVSRNFGKIVAQAIEGRPFVVFAGRLPLMSPLCTAADEALVLGPSGVIGQGAPAELAVRERSFVVRLAGDPKSFLTHLQERGARVAASGDAFTVELGQDGTTAAVFAAAEEAGVVVVELRPVARGFV
jgi:ABC-type multidrug transport system ATPase subunit